MKLYMLIPIAAAIGVVVIVTYIAIRDSRPRRKSLAERFLEANPGVPMDIKADGQTYEHRPAVEDSRKWHTSALIPSDQYVKRNGTCAKCGAYHQPGTEHAR